MCLRTKRNLRSLILDLWGLSPDCSIWKVWATGYNYVEYAVFHVRLHLISLLHFGKRFCISWKSSRLILYFLLEKVWQAVKHMGKYITLLYLHQCRATWPWAKQEISPNLLVLVLKIQITLTFWEYTQDSTCIKNVASSRYSLHGSRSYICSYWHYCRYIFIQDISSIIFLTISIVNISQNLTAEKILEITRLVIFIT